MDVLDDLEGIGRIDAHNMLGFIRNFPEQIEEAMDIASSVEIDGFEPQNIVIAGVGGSAIGGDILASWLFKRIKIPIFVNRAYRLPTFVGKNTLLFAVSYSGNTEETLSLFDEGIRKGCRIIAITSGGELEKRCQDNEVTIIRVPKGKPPRASVAFLFFPIVIMLKKLGIYDPDAEIPVVIETLKGLREQVIPDKKTEENPAKQLALELNGENPIIYGEGIFNSVARRWQTQLNENAKTLSWHATFPEMNHNEIEAWAKDDFSKNFTIIILRDDFRTNNQLQKRVKLTKESILEKHAKKVIEVVAPGEEERDYLARMLYSMYLGDFVSVYIAILKGFDPSPVSTIEAFKRDLAGI
jgi:glucose/mannose-6-phosphate isomerase